MPKRNPNYGRKHRQESARLLAKARKALSNEQQLAVLDLRLGKDVGAVKERRRLNDNSNLSLSG